MDIDAKRFHGFVSPMVINGIIGREGYGNSAEYWLIRKAADRKAQARDSSKEDSKTPYTLADVEQVKAKLDFSAKQRSQLIRQAVKLLPMRPVHISIATGIERRHVSGTLSDMRIRGYVRRMDDGRYEFVKEPTPQKKNLGQEKLRNISIANQPQKKVDAWKDQEGQSVEDWIANGGVIDRSPTPLPFERLSRADIDMSYRAASTAQLRSNRSYLVG